MFADNVSFKMAFARSVVLVVVVVASLVATPALASDQLPGKAQEHPILLWGADVHTVSGEVIAGGQILFDGGKIVSVGKEVPTPANATRIDVTGKRVYPGLFAAGNDLGLGEI